MITKKDFFRLIIKIFGLYFIISTLFSVIPSQFSWAFTDFEPTVIIYVLIEIGIILFLFSSLIFHPNKVIKWLKLDKGFDNNEINIDRFNTENIIKLAIIIIGGNLLIQDIPVFLSHTFYAFKSSAQTNFADDLAYQFVRVNYIDWAISIMNLIVGYLLITNYVSFSKWLTKKKQD